MKPLKLLLISLTIWLIGLTAVSGSLFDLNLDGDFSDLSAARRIQNSVIASTERNSSICPGVSTRLVTFQQAQKALVFKADFSGLKIYGFRKDGLLQKDILFLFDQQNLVAQTNPDCTAKAIIRRWQIFMREVSEYGFHGLGTVQFYNEVFGSYQRNINGLQSKPGVFFATVSDRNQLSCESGLFFSWLTGLDQKIPFGIFDCSRYPLVIRKFDTYFFDVLDIIEVKKVRDDFVDGKGSGGV